MKEKVISVFIDESGDFGQYNPASPNYYVAMVLHNQEMLCLIPCFRMWNLER